MHLPTCMRHWLEFDSNGTDHKKRDRCHSAEGGTEQHRRAIKRTQHNTTQPSTNLLAAKKSKSSNPAGHHDCRSAATHTNGPPPHRHHRVEPASVRGSTRTGGPQATENRRTLDNTKKFQRLLQHTFFLAHVRRPTLLPPPRLSIDHETASHRAPANHHGGKWQSKPATTGVARKKKSITANFPSCAPRPRPTAVWAGTPSQKYIRETEAIRHRPTWGGRN